MEADHHQLVLGRFSKGRAGERAYGGALEQSKKSREAGFFPRAAMVSTNDPGHLLPLMRVCFLTGKMAVMRQGGAGVSKLGSGGNRS